MICTCLPAPAAQNPPEIKILELIAICATTESGNPSIGQLVYSTVLYSISIGSPTRRFTRPLLVPLLSPPNYAKLSPAIFSNPHCIIFQIQVCSLTLSGINRHSAKPSVWAVNTTVHVYIYFSADCASGTDTQCKQL